MRRIRDRMGRRGALMRISALALVISACILASTPSSMALTTSPYFFTDPEFIIAGPALGSGDDFAKSVVVSERTGQYNDETNALVHVAAPRANGGMGSIYSYRTENVIGNAAKFSTLGTFAGVVDRNSSRLTFGGNAGDYFETTPQSSSSPGNTTLFGMTMLVGSLLDGSDGQDFITSSPTLSGPSSSEVLVNATRFLYMQGTCGGSVNGNAAVSASATSSASPSATDGPTATAIATATADGNTSSVSPSASPSGSLPGNGGEIVWAPLVCPSIPNDASVLGQIFASKVDQYSGFPATGAYFSSRAGSTLCRQRPSVAAPIVDCNAQLGASIATGRVRSRHGTPPTSTDPMEIVSGAPLADAAVVYSLSSGGAAGSTTTVAAPLSAEGPDYFGAAVASGKSIDGDGFDDFVVGAPRATDNAAGLAYVGSITGYSAVDGNPKAIFKAYGTQSGAYFGWKVLLADVVATAADFNKK
eukprot:Opistho-2@7548